MNFIKKISHMLIVGLVFAQAPTIKSMDLSTVLTVGLASGGYLLYSMGKKLHKGNLLYRCILRNDISSLSRMVIEKKLFEERLYGITPLHHAVSYRRNVALAVLLAAGANPNVYDNSRDGITETALNCAASKLNKDAVALLMACGALPLLTDDGGRDAFFIASHAMDRYLPEEEIKAKRTEVIDLLNSRQTSTEYVLTLLREHEDFVVLPQKIKDALEARILAKRMHTAVQLYIKQNKQEPLRAQLTKNNWAFRHFTSPCIVASQDDDAVICQRPALSNEIIHNIFSYLDRDQLSDKEFANALKRVKHKAVIGEHAEMLKLTTTAQENLQLNTTAKKKVKNRLSIRSRL